MSASIHGSAGLTPRVTAEAPTSEIQTELNRLATACDTLANIADHFFQRLAPVTRCTGVGSANSAMPPSPPRAVLSPIADRIDNLRVQIEGVTNNLSASIDALAV